MNIDQIWKTLKAIILQWNFSTPLGEKIYTTALSKIGQDASPNDVAPDELGCAETVTEILRASGIQIPVLVSTTKLYEQLNADSRWLKVEKPIRGDIILSPTGSGGPRIKNGHVGIMCDSYRVMSNSSLDGIFRQNYNLDTWKTRWFEYPVFFYRRIGA